MFRSQRGVALIAVAGVVALVAVVVVLYLLLPARTVSGQVVDALTGRPVPGALLRLEGGEIQTGLDGNFSLSGARFGATVNVAAKGYIAFSSTIGMDDRLRLALNPRVLQGLVSDGSTKKPIEGAKLSSDSLTATTDAQGRFSLIGIEPGTDIAVSMPGYVRTAIAYGGQQSADLALQPASLDVKVLNQFTGQPLQDADVSDGKTTARTGPQGSAQLLYLLDGAQIDIRLDGFAPAKIVYSGQGMAETKLRPDTLTGTVKDPTGKPIAGATITDGRSNASTDSAGSFKLSGLAENTRVTVSATARERKTIEVGQNTTLDVTLKPFAARGTYLTYYGVGDEGLRERMLTLADTTEINAVVIDVKGDFGFLAYRSNVPLVKEIGAQQEIMIQDPKKFLADLKKRGIYTIARIVAFKDKPLATARPQWSVINSGTGKPWIDGEGLNWMDATREEVWDYNIALAVEAIQNGFDEVQFDYVRFPTDESAGNSLDSIRFSKPNTMEVRTSAINGFLEKAAKSIHAAGGAISADIFGYVVWHTGDDMGIGQILEEVAKRVDYVSPMVYPNLFWSGIEVDGTYKYGDRKSGLYPYEIVKESLKVAAARVGAGKLRPWLEYYNDYITDKTYGDAEMKAQKRGAYENGIDTWLFWDPSNRFVKGGFEPKSAQ